MNLFAHENQHSNGNIFFGKRGFKPSAVTPHPGYSLREAALDLQSENGEQTFPMSLLENSPGVEDRQVIGVALAAWPAKEGLLAEDMRWSKALLVAALDDEDEDDDIEDDDDLEDEDEEDFEDEDDENYEEEDEDEDEDYEDEDEEEE